jgi:hypothetical protein
MKKCIKRKEKKGREGKRRDGVERRKEGSIFGDRIT